MEYLLAALATVIFLAGLGTGLAIAAYTHKRIVDSVDDEDWTGLLKDYDELVNPPSVERQYGKQNLVLIQGGKSRSLQTGNLEV